MATKAERFRYETERSGPKKAKQPRPARRDTPVDTALPGVSATSRKSARHESVRAGKKAQYALEDSAGKPSRKSTRKASNRQKTDSQMRVKRRTGEMRPESRGQRGR
ncbi:conserved hypothetical protein [Anaeromyxobacter dehalogenans 2CP-1]|uniref:Uncharacterized protein n=1 Tax=Anaeromyxobacter dehalogenans (strain ATCC BAA-258 / DSM 21875 / 2CP-1) TaxID=455488 RepID=B8JGX2_ANAD2|nr:hypothetical protein [Anaeromyxobacter dehalogenans]ACL66609.1 conserved hypothetical protein [Anaeromyxobacter dehalogenans 2CP-1]